MSDFKDSIENDVLDSKITNLAASYRLPDSMAMDSLREDMWAAIEAKRSAPTASAINKKSSWVIYALAASLLLVVGMSIGAHITRKDSTVVIASGQYASDVGDPLDHAAAVHFSEAAILLASFNGNPADKSLDDKVMASAQDLLSKTRLLLDSHPHMDPQRVKLLKDLETILVQIVRLPSTSAGVERKIITDAITTEQVIPKLQLAGPKNI